MFFPFFWQWFLGCRYALNVEMLHQGPDVRAIVEISIPVGIQGALKQFSGIRSDGGTADKSRCANQFRMTFLRRCDQARNVSKMGFGTDAPITLFGSFDRATVVAH